VSGVGSVVLHHWGANDSPPNPLAGLRGHFQMAEKGRREGKRKVTDGTEENIPGSQFMVTALASCVHFGKYC